MKVALAFPGCHRRAGVERVVFDLADYLAEREHEVHVYANEWEAGHRAIRHHFVPARGVWFLSGASYFRESTRRLRATSYDVLYTHGTVCPTGGVHFVHSLHRAWLERAAEMRPPLSAARSKQRLNPLHPILLRLEQKHFGERRYRAVGALTETVREDLGRHYGVPAGDVTVIPLGFSPERFNPAHREARRPAMREALGLRPEHVALLFVAHELERKGFDTLLEAVRLLGREALRVLVVGRTDTREVRRRAQRHGVGDRVIACGPTDRVADFHAAGDVFVLPTQYEAFSGAILEALGSGMPVVTTNVPGARDAIVPDVNGYLVDDPRSPEQLAVALERLECPGTRARLSEQAAATVEEYHWSRVFPRHEALLESFAT